MVATAVAIKWWQKLLNEQLRINVNFSSYFDKGTVLEHNERDDILLLTLGVNRRPWNSEFIIFTPFWTV